MSDPLVWMAFTTGLLGFGHCLGMCGGLVGALTLSEAGRRGGLAFQSLYHAGRIITYTGIGALVGWIGSALAYAQQFRLATRSLLLFSDLFIILVGLGTAGLFVWLRASRLEFATPARLLQGAVAVAHRLPPPLAGLGLGLLFGFLPCGYLYAVAIAAAQSASLATGALMLLVFGLGTAPGLLLFGGAARWLSQRARSWLLRGAGLLVAGMGVVNLVRHLRMLGWL